MVAVTQRGSVTTRAGDVVLSLHANELTLLDVDGRCMLLSNSLIADHPRCVLDAINCLRHGLVFDIGRYL